jgi:hypothetical protein
VYVFFFTGFLVYVIALLVKSGSKSIYFEWNFISSYSPAFSHVLGPFVS